MSRSEDHFSLFNIARFSETKMPNCHYRNLLEESYIETHKLRLDMNKDEINRLRFLSDGIFDFTTYEEDICQQFAVKALEVCEAISTQTTFEYIKTEENHLWFLLMVNMPFFAGRISWGTSIRGAWWDGDIELTSCDLWMNGEQFGPTVKFTNDLWHEFVAAMLEFAREEADAWRAKQQRLPDSKGIT